MKKQNEAPPVSNEHVAPGAEQFTAPAETKPKAPRRESTKVAAANKIAATHPNPTALMMMLDGSADDTESVLAGLKQEIDDAEKRVADLRADYRGRKAFAEEIAGLPQGYVLGVKAILESRAK